MTICSVRRGAIKCLFSVQNSIYSVASWFCKTFDLLDLTLCASFTLITSGVYMLWGKGWSCITLGVLLLALVVVGIPVKQVK